MATTVHEPPKIEPERLPSQGSGNGGWRNLVPADGDVRRVRAYSPPPASTGIWVGLSAITMTFAALTSALVVRQGSAPDWQHITLPPILYLNTLVIIASSVALEIARRRVAAFMGGAERGGRESGAMALHNPGLRTALCCGADLRLAATASAGIWAGHQRELFVFLRADCGARSACAGRARRHGSRDRKITRTFPQRFRAAKKHSGRDFALLAFHGCAVAVSAFAALDEALNEALKQRSSGITTLEPSQRWEET